MKLVRAPHGKGREEIDISSVQIQDCWHAAMALEEPHRAMVLDTWHLAHDLLNALRGDPDYIIKD